MHNAVGLWFTPLSLGVFYYALPKLLNRPIYSYSLGVFAFWTKQRSSGGRARLFGISKRGDRYLRTLMIHGARAALGKAAGKQDPPKPLAW